MKISVSLPQEDVDMLDSYVHAAGLSSRSAAVQRAVRLLRDAGLEDDYAAAWDEWETSGEAAAWMSPAGDGLADAAR
ncbi:ribbon-helix-helix domain-containing protein [Tomitella cavernea]|uniref:Type II toxin-antitoxin system antitoxin MazE9 n=1 Tax=Tomitella cavernea TaxID=1387982 RepID=A0ABP9C399_9ACTN|nr:ribbon-helix-helix domain-containing protein [Tomitella cavernea]